MYIKRLSFAALLLLAGCDQSAQVAGAANPAATKQPAAEAASAQTTSNNASGSVEEDPRLKLLTGRPAPAIALQTLTGATLDLGEVYGKRPVYLKMWASYCIPCRAQMPKFERIYQTLGEKMHIVAVNAGVGDDAAKVAAFANQTGIHMPIAIDDGSLSSWLKMQGTPVHLVIGNDGRVLFAGQGDGPELDAALEQALASPKGLHAPISRPEGLPRVRPGDVVPAIGLLTAAGGAVTLPAGGTGQPRAILFTATWCEEYLRTLEPQTSLHCEKTRVAVDTLAKASSAKWAGIVTHLWTTPDTLAAYQKQHQPAIEYAIDGDGIAFRQFGIQRFPAIALIDAQGKLLRIVGPDDDLKQAVKALDAQS